MGRIEKALAKLQARGERATDPGAPQRPAGRLVEATPRDQLSEHVYGGKRIEIDLEQLRHHGLLAPVAQERQIADQFRLIKRPLLGIASRTREPSVPFGNLLMVGSANAAEGKTFTSINLCLSMAREEDWSVVLVDADCTKPQISRLFGAEEEPGFLDLLRDGATSFDEFVMPTSIPKFSLLPAGRYDAHATELFTSARMESLRAELTADPQRLVVFDTPPLLLTSEAPALATSVGQIVLVVRADYTLQQDVAEALARLDRTKPVNLLLNQSDQRSAASYGGYHGALEARTDQV